MKCGKRALFDLIHDGKETPVCAEHKIWAREQAKSKDISIKFEIRPLPGHCGKKVVDETK